MSVTKRDIFKVGAVASAVAALTGLVRPSNAESATQGGQNHDLLQRIHALEAESRIRYKIATYTRACDRLDLDLAATLFAPNSYADYGPGIFQGTGPALMQWLHGVDSTFYAEGAQFQHVACQSTIEVNNDVAASETYGYAIAFSPGTNNNNKYTISLARYLDRWTYINGDWFIHKRVVTSDGGFNVTSNLPLYPRYNFATDKTDPSYQILNILSRA